MEYIVIVILGILLVLQILYSRQREKQLLIKLEHMILDARNGNFEIERIDESMLSSVENEMNRFLEDSCVAEKNLMIQKEKIQTLISDISHQTVTPISNIRLYSELLEEEIQEQEIKENIQAIREQTEKLGFLIDSLVKTSRLETGIIKVEPKRQSIKTMLEETAAQFQTKAAQKKIGIFLQEENLNIEAVFDYKWTREAVCNLLDNAIKYTKAGGSIRIAVGESTMYCRIDIIDTGVGISEEEIAKLFGRFYRSEKTKEEEGVGLGLYLAREILQNEKGYIKVKSKPDEGSIFSVYLPKEK